MFSQAVEFFREGGVLMGPLLFCSFVSLTFIIERAIFWIRLRLLRNRKLVMEVLDLLRKGNTETARSRAASSRDFLLKTVALGLGNGLSSLQGTMEMAYREEERSMNRFMIVLDTIVTLAPLLGILGTVLGIIESFDILGSSTGTTDPLAVMSGISKALITTAAGLAIAIVTLIPYNFFRARTENSLNEIEEVATFLEVTLTGSGRGPESTP